MITGCLQKKNGYYYAVLYLKENGKRKRKKKTEMGCYQAAR